MNYNWSDKRGNYIWKRKLTIEEQFKETLNNEEIDRIEDPKLRAIRDNHWVHRMNIFRDEHNISDKLLLMATAN